MVGCFGFQIDQWPPGYDGRERNQEQAFFIDLFSDRIGAAVEVRAHRSPPLGRAKMESLLGTCIRVLER